MKNKEFLDAIVTIRLFGQLKTGHPSDIKFKDIFRNFYGKGAFFVMKNTNKLTSKEFEEVKVETGSVDEIEERLIRENTGKSGIFNAEKEQKIIQELMHAFAEEKLEGETSADFEKRVKKAVSSVFH
jgi:hypothetical protein